MNKHKQFNKDEYSDTFSDYYNIMNQLEKHCEYNNVFDQVNMLYLHIYTIFNRDILKAELQYEN